MSPISYTVLMQKLIDQRKTLKEIIAMRTHADFDEKWKENFSQSRDIVEDIIGSNAHYKGKGHY